MNTPHQHIATQSSLGKTREPMHVTVNQYVPHAGCFLSLPRAIPENDNNNVPTNQPAPQNKPRTRAIDNSSTKISRRPPKPPSSIVDTVLKNTIAGWAQPTVAPSDSNATHVAPPAPQSTVPGYYVPTGYAQQSQNVAPCVVPALQYGPTSEFPPNAPAIAPCVVPALSDDCRRGEQWSDVSSVAPWNFPTLVSDAFHGELSPDTASTAARCFLPPLPKDYSRDDISPKPRTPVAHSITLDPVTGTADGREVLQNLSNRVGPANSLSSTRETDACIATPALTATVQAVTDARFSRIPHCRTGPTARNARSEKLLRSDPESVRREQLLALHTRGLQSLSTAELQQLLKASRPPEQQLEDIAQQPVLLPTRAELVWLLLVRRSALRTEMRGCDPVKLTYVLLSRTTVQRMRRDVRDDPVDFATRLLRAVQRDRAMFSRVKRATGAEELLGIAKEWRSALVQRLGRQLFSRRAGGLRSGAGEMRGSVSAGVGGDRATRLGERRGGQQ